jgi:3-hydroxybutyryl-CoA dehydratase
MGDANPLHNDENYARSTRLGGLIACGPHISGLHACMLPTWLSNRCVVLGREFTTKYVLPIRAECEYRMWWQLEDITEAKRGYVVEARGAVEVAVTGECSISATGSLLLLESL